MEDWNWIERNWFANHWISSHWLSFLHGHSQKVAITRVGHVLKHSFVTFIVKVCPSTTNIDFRKVSNAYLCDDFLTAHFSLSVFHTLFYISAMQCFIFPILILWVILKRNDDMQALIKCNIWNICCAFFVLM